MRLGLYDKNGFKALCGDAKKMSNGCGDVHALDTKLLDGASLIVDAIFGAGISRPVSGHVKELLQAADNSGVPIVAVDLLVGKRRHWRDFRLCAKMPFYSDLFPTQIRTFFRPRSRQDRELVR